MDKKEVKSCFLLKKEAMLLFIPQPRNGQTLSLDAEAEAHCGSLGFDSVAFAGPSSARQQ